MGRRNFQNHSYTTRDRDSRPAVSGFCDGSTPPASVSTTADSELSFLQREQDIAYREADLAGRRRETARMRRQQTRQQVSIDTKLEHIELSMAELAQAFVNQFCPDDKPANAGASVTEISTLDLEAFEAELSTLRDQIESLTGQNQQLASNLAQSSVRRTIDQSSDSSATLSWEERKALLFAQDLETTSSVTVDETEVARLHATVQRLRDEIESRDIEIGQLRDLLETRPQPCEDGLAMGAAAIAQLMDSDELIVEERQRLRNLQAEWESKFRESEIAASIERANLARDRQTLHRRNLELEEQLAHLKDELRQEEVAGPAGSRRWLAKLGLAD